MKQPLQSPPQPVQLASSQDTSDVNSKLRGLVLPLCEVHGVHLVDVKMVREPVGLVLRVMIERITESLQQLESESHIYKSHVTLEDCQHLSRDLAVSLDVNDIFKGRYHLEVGSPGIERPLTSPADAARFSGFDVKGRFHHAVLEQKTFSGTLEGLLEGQVHIRSGDTLWVTPFDNIAKMHLVFRV